MASKVEIMVKVLEDRGQHTVEYSKNYSFEPKTDSIDEILGAIELMVASAVIVDMDDDWD